MPKLLEMLAMDVKEVKGEQKESVKEIKIFDDEVDEWRDELEKLKKRMW